MFASHLNLFNGTMPLSDKPVPFPPSSFLSSCPNLNPSEGSCCNAASVNFTVSFIERFTSNRARLLSSFSSLTVHSLYTALTNHSSPHVNLTVNQTAILQSILTKLKPWVTDAFHCVDHWMGYVSSLFCLACDPHHSHYAHNPFPGVPPRLTLQLSTCTSIFSACFPAMSDLLGQQLKVLLDSLQAFVYETPEYHTSNYSSAWWSYGMPLYEVAKEMPSVLNIDLCNYAAHGQVFTDCQRAFCTGSQLWQKPDSYSPSGFRFVDTVTPHAFRGANYAQGLLTLDQLVNVNAYFAFILCLLRLGFNAQADYDSFARHADGCPRSANALHLLFGSEWEATSPMTSAYFDEGVHGYPREATDCRVDYASSIFTYPARPDVADTCQLSGYATPVWVNTSNAAQAWAGYEVGCRLNLSKVICGVGDAPPGPEVEGLTETLRVGFIVLVVGGLVGLGGTVVGLGWRFRKTREQRSREQLREALNPAEDWNGWSGWPTGDGEEDTAAFLSSLGSPQTGTHR